MFSFSKKLKSKRWFLPTLLLVVAVVLFIPKGSALAAGDLQIGMLGGIVCAIIATVLYIPAMIATYLMQLGGKVLSAVMAKSFNENLYIHSPFVQIAWGFCRDFANIFFIVWLVIIAVCLMLDIKSFNAKKRLIQLVSIALLVNFSLIFCGFMIDIAQGLMYFFTQTMVRINDGQQPYSLADGLTKAFRQNELFGAAVPPAWEFVGIDSAGSLNVALKNLMVLVFSGVAAYGFITLAVMLIVRIVALWILLIFAPLAWVFGIMPFGKSASTQWWREFWAWCFYGVTMAFFLYIACMAVWALDKAESWKNFQNVNAGTMQGFDVPLLNNFSMLLQYMVVMVLIIVAIKFGKKGTSQATNMASGYIGKQMSKTFGKQGMGGWAWKKTGGAAWEGAKNQAGKYKDNLKNRFGAGMGRLGDRLPSGAGRVLARKGAKMQENARKSQEKRTGEAFDYSHLTEDEKIALVFKLRGRELEKMTQDLIKNNSVQKIDRNNPQQQEALDRMYEIARRPGNERMLNDFEARRLDMSLSSRRLTQADIDGITDDQRRAAAQKDRKELLERATKSGQLKDEDVIKSLSAEQLADIVLDPDAGKVLSRGFEDFSKETREKAVSRTQEAINNMGIAENFDVNNTDKIIRDQAKNNVKLREFMAKNSGDYYTAFEITPERLNTMQPGTDPGQREYIINQSEEAMRTAIGKINGEKEWEKVDMSKEDNVRAMARHIQASQIGNAGRFLDDTKKNKIRDELKTLSLGDKERRDVLRKMSTNDLWPGSIDEESTKRDQKAKKLRTERRKEREKKQREQTDRTERERRANEQDEIERQKLQIEQDRRTEEIANRTREEQERQQKEAIKKGRAETEAYQEEVSRSWDAAYAEKKERERGQGGGGGEVPPNPPDDGGPNVPPNRTPEQPINTGNNGGGRTIDMEQGEDGEWTVPENNRGRGASGGDTTMQGGTINAESATINAQNVNIQTPEGISNRSQMTSIPPTIITPESRGNVKFSSQGASDREKIGREMRDEATAKAKEGNIDEAIKIAELIEEEKRQGYALWEIASIQAEKGDFGSAIATARKIKNKNIRSSALHEIETMQERKREE
ncbi:MAG: hypothetical protein WC242_02985 [Candidatus Paceibacterota bacterium]|jgi:hypothetical protein